MADRVSFGPGEPGLQRIERLPDDYRGYVYRFDLDKTYLATPLGDIRRMVRIPFEKPEQKVAVPGMPALLRALRSRRDEDSGLEPGVVFISASPAQLGRAIVGKLKLDDVSVDAVVFKDVMGMVVRLQGAHIKEQVGYKLRELLRGRAVFPESTREVLFGDDWEKDAVAYTLYADAISGRMSVEEVAAALDEIGVLKEWREEILERLDALPRADAVERIYINLERGGPLDRFDAYGSLLVPTFNAFQASLSLAAHGNISPSGLLQVAQNMLEEFDYDPMRLRNSFEDLMRRGLLPLPEARRFATLLAEAGAMAPVELPEDPHVPAPGLAERVRKPFETVLRWVKALRREDEDQG